MSSINKLPKELIPSSSLLKMLGAVPALALMAGVALSQDAPPPIVSGTGTSTPPPQSVVSGAIAQTASQVQAFWSGERMRAAQPIDMPFADATKGRVVSQQQSLPADAEPGVISGWDPESGLPQPSANPTRLPKKAAAQSDSAQPLAFGSPPSNPLDYANYGKFQRWTWYGRYLTYPTSVIGKLFFSKPSGTFVCSATVVNRNTILTAGHCVSDGAGNFHSNFMFCPSYNASGVNPSRGCWAAVNGFVTSQYHSSANLDRDYACLVTNATGTVHAAAVGDITGWAGLAWNWGADELMFSTGYPAGAPFNGTNIIFTAANEWYAIDMGAGDGNVSKYMGNDQTGGSSGGAWLMSLRHRNSEYPVVDNSSITDPVATSGAARGPYVNGVNSHRRCLSNCSLPPTSTQGQFWSEMASPVFFESGTDNNDISDVVGLCTSNGGS